MLGKKDKRFIKNWRPISLLNRDMKIISKVLSTRIENVLPFLISSNQRAYVKNRFISESGRVISDILEISNSLALEGFLVAVDIEKAFDSVNHCFLLQILRKFGFGIDFVSWIKTILNNQESCIINGGKTTKYFKLERGARQGYPTSAYLFILVLEIFFFVKNNRKVKGFNIFNPILFGVSEVPYFIWGVGRGRGGKNALPLYFLNQKWYDNETWHTLRPSYAK